MITTKSDVSHMVSRLTILDVIILSTANLFNASAFVLVLVQGLFTICAFGYAIYFFEQKLSSLSSEIEVLKAVLKAKNTKESEL